MRFRIAAIIFMIFTTIMPGWTQTKDSDQLGMAIEYFQSGKYHEALNIFCKLETKHELNPRFKAYMGVCFYYEWDYANAAAYLDKALPQLSKLAPHERSFYCFACAESHFELQEYGKALPLYNEMITLCYDNEKADAYYKIGFIYMFQQQWTDALDNFQSALVYYTQFRPDQKSRIAQIRNMINGCVLEIERRKPPQAKPPCPPVGGTIRILNVGTHAMRPQAAEVSLIFCTFAHGKTKYTFW